MKYFISIFKERVAWLFFCVCMLVYLMAPVTQLSDSNYSMMVSQSLIESGTVRLDGYNIERYEPYSKPGIVHSGYPYQIENIGEKLYYYFPHGTSILSMPFVAVFNAFGLSTINDENGYSLAGEIKIERILSAILVSFAATMFYLTSRVSLSVPVSLVIALAGAFGTPLLSTASRAMWAHTWLLVLLSLTIYLVWRAIQAKKTPSPVLLASLVSWMFFVRPTSSISIVAISVIVLIVFRPIFVTYCVVGLLWLAGFVLYSQYHFDTYLPSYYLASRLGSNTYAEALLGNMISPARGLLESTQYLCVSFSWFEGADHKKAVAVM